MHDDDGPGGTALAVHPGNAVALATVADDARGYVAASLAPATRRAYRTDLEAVHRVVRRAGRDALPAEPATLILYLSGMAGQRSHGAAVATAHVDQPGASPRRPRVADDRPAGAASVAWHPSHPRHRQRGQGTSPGPRRAGHGRHPRQPCRRQPGPLTAGSGPACNGTLAMGHARTMRRR
jgi:hypothetical protein